MTIKLSELESAVAAMTSGEWRAVLDEGDRYNIHSKKSWIAVLPGRISEHRESESNAAGIVAIRNVAPVLIEIAKAALKFHGSTCDHPEGRCQGDSHFRGCPVFSAERRLNDALDEVEL